MVSSAERIRLILRRRPLELAAATIVCGASVSGCVSTEQRAGWAHIEDARIIASQSSVIVRRADRQVRVTRVSMLDAGGRVAIAVGLRNTTSHPLNDLPISIGLSIARGATVYLNRAAGLDYFKTHVAEIPPRKAITWVFTGPRPRHFSGRPFAVAGSQTAPPITVADSIPSIRAVLSSARQPAGDRAVRVTVTNLSSIPQVGLQIYALARAAGRYSAAGSATVANLEAGNSTTTRVELVGRPRGAPVQLEALPTLFR